MVRLVRPMPSRKHRYPRGYSERAGLTKIAVSLRTETFNRLLFEAKQENVSFSDMVERTIISAWLNKVDHKKLERV